MLQSLGLGVRVQMFAISLNIQLQVEIRRLLGWVSFYALPYQLTLIDIA